MADSSADPSIICDADTLLRRLSDRFMTLPLVESNEVFRDAVRRLTDGRFPFPE